MTKTWKDHPEMRKQVRGKTWQRRLAMLTLTCFNEPAEYDEQITCEPAFRQSLAEYIRRGGYFDPRSM